MPKQLLNNSKPTFKNPLKIDFLTLKMVKITLSEGQILANNFDFRGLISTFRTENTPKSGAFKAKNNALTTSEQLQTNFQKVQKTTFLALKMAKSRVPILAKVSIFGCILDLKPQILPQKCSNRF